jgi:hypothetical protein
MKARLRTSLVAVERLVGGLATATLALMTLVLMIFTFLGCRRYGDRSGRGRPVAHPHPADRTDRRVAAVLHYLGRRAA